MVQQVVQKILKLLCMPNVFTNHYLILTVHLIASILGIIVGIIIEKFPCR